MLDTVIIGFNDRDFATQVQETRAMGSGSGMFKDLDLAFIEHQGQPLRALDAMTRFWNEAHPHDRKFFSNVDFFWPTITYLGSYLHRRGFSFGHVNLFQQEKERLRRLLTEQRARTVAITTTLYVTPQPVMDIVRFVRAVDPTVQVVVGGPFVRNQTADSTPDTLRLLLDHVGADLYIDSNEGEQTFARLLGALRDGSPLDPIPNLIWRRNGAWVMNPREPEANPLEDNPIDYGLFGPQVIGQFVSLRTAKSCPFSCAFCGFPQRAGKYTYVETALVERELDALKALGSVTTLTFLDDTFNVPKRRFKEILRMMIAKDYGFRWNSFFRSDHGDEETIALMAQAGCEGVFLGAESGSDHMLDRMNKTSRRRDYVRAIEAFRQNGVSTYASLVIGFPGETYDTVEETISFVEEARPDFYRAQLWYADPVTPVWKQREELGIRGNGFTWSHNTMDAETACDLIDRMYLSIGNSTWLPQAGFEQWSTFYLQRHGMSLDQVKAFLTAFNDGVKQKLVYPTRREADAPVIARLRAASRLGATPSDRAALSSAFDPAAYRAAEAAWTSLFRGGPAQSPLEGLLADNPGDGTPARVPVPVPDALAGLDGPALLDGMAVALSTLLAGLSARDDLVLLLAGPGCGDAALPLRLRTGPETTGSAALADVAGLRTRLAPHGAFGCAIANNQWRLARFNATRPVLDIAVALETGTGGDALAWLRDFHGEIAGGLALVLAGTVGPDGPALWLEAPGGAFSAETLLALAGPLAGVLAALARDPSRPLTTLLAGDAPAPAHALAEAGLADSFDFS